MHGQKFIRFVLFFFNSDEIVAPKYYTAVFKPLKSDFLISVLNWMLDRKKYFYRSIFPKLKYHDAVEARICSSVCYYLIRFVITIINNLT